MVPLGVAGASPAGSAAASVVAGVAGAAATGAAGVAGATTGVAPSSRARSRTAGVVMIGPPRTSRKRRGRRHYSYSTLEANLAVLIKRCAGT